MPSARDAAKDIEQSITSIQAAAKESIGVMYKDITEVERKVAFAKRVNASLDSIVSA